jgi:hypothetical protein
MSGLNSFAVDTEKEENGIWEKVGDMEFLVARAMNSEWKRMAKRLEATAFGNTRKKEKDPEKELDILIKCLAYTAILDWRNVTLDGEELKYSKEECYKILSDKRFKLLLEELIELSVNQERFREESIEDDVKK